MHWDWVDPLLIVLMALAALHGLRVGALTQLLTFGGFWIGFALGVLLSVTVFSSVHTNGVKAALVVALTLGLASLCGVFGRVLGSWSNATLRRHHLSKVDSAFGVGVALVAVLLSAWLVANVVSSSSSRYTALSQAASKSDILRAIDNVLPPAPNVLLKVQSFLNEQGFPPVFADLTPAPATPVARPTSAETQGLADPAVFSTVKVEGVACNEQQEGSGFVVGRNLVVTNAHVVAGEASTQIIEGSTAYKAVPIAFDPNLDLAVLRTKAPLGPALTLAPTIVARGTQAAVLGYPEDGPLTVDAAGIATNLTATGRDIYNQGLVTRDIYQIDAAIRPGNSGGPLMGPGGQVVGVVFSRSTTDPGVGYALSSPEVLTRLQQAETHTTGVSTGACTTD